MVAVVYFLLLVNRNFPRLIRIINFDLLQSFQRFGPQILLIDNPFVANDERFNPCNCCGAGEDWLHDAFDRGHIIHCRAACNFESFCAARLGSVCTIHRQ